MRKVKSDLVDNWIAIFEDSEGSLLRAKCEVETEMSLERASRHQGDRQRADGAVNGNKRSTEDISFANSQAHFREEKRHRHSLGIDGDDASRSSRPQSSLKIFRGSSTTSSPPTSKEEGEE